MIAFINSVVAGVGAAFLAGDLLGSDQTALAMSLGVALAVALIIAFVAYERWRFRIFDRAEPSEEPEQHG
jgi:Na+-driven multidrug efflux pump